MKQYLELKLMILLDGSGFQKIGIQNFYRIVFFKIIAIIQYIIIEQMKKLFSQTKP